MASDGTLTLQTLCTNLHAEMPQCGEETGALSGSGDSEDVLLSLPRTLKKGRRVVQGVRVKTLLWENKWPT